MKFLVLIAACVAVASAIGLGRKQSAGVRGQLVCEGKPASNVKVKLYDDDRGIDTDDLMASGRTDSQGRFELSGYTYEFTTIDPKLNVYHDCNDGLTPCQRKISIMIPDKYISSGEHPENYFNAGVIEMAGIYKGEERDCIN
uniref:Transthyretin-like family protein n=1 Tax=Panagrolaimus sp. JU765 TaxID=591449 RepID=A0AC34QFW2_9BILA